MGGSLPQTPGATQAQLLHFGKSIVSWNPVFPGWPRRPLRNPVFCGFVRPMIGTSRPESRQSSKDPRKERLAKALRDNLKRRKAQARERAAGAPADQPDAAADADSGRED
jgi:hypothetical protein